MSSNRSTRGVDNQTRGPFLGRKSELANLCEAVEAVHARRGGKRWIAGPSGIGKSRLLEEIAKYASLRHVPVERLGQDAVLHVPEAGPGLIILDPISADRVAEVDAWLDLVAAGGALGLATAPSVESCREHGIRDAHILALAGLRSQDAVRLLRVWVGGDLDLEWAKAAVESTGGEPRRLKFVAERFLETAQRGRRPDGFVGPDGAR